MCRDIKAALVAARLARKLGLAEIALPWRPWADVVAIFRESFLLNAARREYSCRKSSPLLCMGPDALLENFLFRRTP